MDPSANRSFQVGPIRVAFLIDALDSGGSVTLFECRMSAASKVALAHSHDGFEETIYGLEGTSTWHVDGREQEVGPGESLCVRRGQQHWFENRTDAEIRLLSMSTPGLFGPDYFRDLEAVLAGEGPPDPAAIGAVMRRHGLTPAG